MRVEHRPQSRGRFDRVDCEWRGRKPEPLDDATGPSSASCVEQTRRRGRGHLIGELAREPEADQVTNEHQPLRREARRGIPLGEQLEYGVDGHRLDAGRRIQLLARHPLVDAGNDPVGACIPVVERQTEDLPLPVE